MDERTIARFWAKVDRRGPDECWLWTGSMCQRGGYGHFRRGAAIAKVHRVSWELANGPIPDGEGYHGTCVCHRCDVRHCVNPSHLFLGTNAENVADRNAKGRQARLRGESNAWAKLTAEVVVAMRADRSAGMLYREIGAKYGVSKTQARDVACRKSWAHVA